MKKIVLLSVIASTMIIAGGDFAPVEPIIETPMVVVEEPTPSAFYLGLAYGFIGEEYTRRDNNVVDSIRSFDEDFSSIMLQAGYSFNPYIAVEGRYWFGIDDVTPAGYVTAVDAPDAWGVYVKPMYPVTDAIDVYGLLGYAEVETLNNLSGFSWGAGASYAFTDNVSMFVDYTSLHNDDKSFVNEFGNTINKEYLVDSVNVGVTYNF